MFQTRQQIFDERADWFHQAMTLSPRARANEFALAFEQADLADGMKVADMPSGGGYLREFLPVDLDVDLISIDSSAGFSRYWNGDAAASGHLCPLEKTPLVDGHVDRILSVAGLHHVEHRLAVFAEMRRILKPDGRLCLVEVPSGAITDGFLNDFVDGHNSMGHEGRFVDAVFRADLESAGFDVSLDELRRFTWDFAGEDEMLRYFRLLFGIDQATDREILSGVSRFLGYETKGAGSRVNWELQLICCQ